jgi:capsular polysaccharide transport system ATP-binding protein
VELFQKRADRAMIIVSHDISYIREHCSRASVLDQGKLINFKNVDNAFEYYQNTINQI